MERWRPLPLQACWFLPCYQIRSSALQSHLPYGETCALSLFFDLMQAANLTASKAILITSWVRYQQKIRVIRKKVTGDFLTARSG